MTDDMFLPESTPIQRASLIRPMVEMEIAFVIGSARRARRPAGRCRARHRVRAPRDRDRRLPGRARTRLRDRRHRSPISPRAEPQSSARTRVASIRSTSAAYGAPCHATATVEQEGEASAVLGNPVTAVAWLANKLAEFGIAFDPATRSSPVRSSGACPGRGGRRDRVRVRPRARTASTCRSSDTSCVGTYSTVPLRGAGQLAASSVHQPSLVVIVEVVAGEECCVHEGDDATAIVAVAVGFEPSLYVGPTPQRRSGRGAVGGAGSGSCRRHA